MHAHTHTSCFSHTHSCVEHGAGKVLRIIDQAHLPIPTKLSLVKTHPTRRHAGEISWCVSPSFRRKMPREALGKEGLQRKWMDGLQGWGRDSPYGCGRPSPALDLSPLRGQCRWCLGDSHRPPCPKLAQAASTLNWGNQSGFKVGFEDFSFLVYIDRNCC